MKTTHQDGPTEQQPTAAASFLADFALRLWDILEAESLIVETLQRDFGQTDEREKAIAKEAWLRGAVSVMAWQSELKRKTDKIGDIPK